MRVGKVRGAGARRGARCDEREWRGEEKDN